MEQKLAKYRAKKAREAKIEKLKASTKHFFSGLWRSREKTASSTNPEPTEEALLPQKSPETESASSINSEDIDDSLNCCTWADFFYYLLWFALWVVLYVIFIEYQFGMVFLVSSAIIFMYMNTRTGPKRPDEVSAYSVFNKNCESIDGTLKAEQFEREIRYGPSATR